MDLPEQLQDAAPAITHPQLPNGFRVTGKAVILRGTPGVEAEPREVSADWMTLGDMG